MTNEVEVYFALKGEHFDPDAFTTLCGLEPTNAWRKGEPCGPANTYQFGLWEMSTGRIENDVLFVGEIVDQLIEKISAAADCFARVVAEQKPHAVLEVVLYVSVDHRLSTPALGFSSQAIEFLHHVGATIDVDIYRN